MKLSIKDNPGLLKLAYYGWLVLALAIFLLCGSFTYSLFSGYYEKSDNAVKDGKRVAIIVETGEVVIRATEEDDKQEDIKKDEEEKNDATSTVSEEVKDEGDNKNPPTANATPPVQNNGEAKLAILVTNLGINKATTEAVKKLPKEVTMSFSPYTVNLGKLMEESKKAGHEILLDLPMQTRNYPYDDPGPDAILTDAGKAKNMFRLKSTLSLAENYPGVMTYVDEQITHSLVNILPIIDELKKRNLFLIYNEKQSNEFLRQEARAVGLAFIPSYIVIDEILQEDEIDAKLNEARSAFEKEGKKVLIVARPYPLTIKRLENFLSPPKESEKQLKISPVSQLQEM